MTQSQGPGRLDQKEKDAAIMNMVFYILVREKGRPFHKRADLMKAVNLNGKKGLDQDEVLDSVKLSLEDVFGYRLQPMDEMMEEEGDARAYKNTFMLINNLAHAVYDATKKYIPTGSVVKNGNTDPAVAEMAHERAKTSLLYSLLSLIFMSPSSRVHDESLDNFLVKMGLMADFNRDTAPSHQHEIQGRLMKMFGVTDIKAFIKEEYCKKQHYIQVIESDGPDEVTKKYEYRWGIRAQAEMRKVEILKNVAALYQCQPSDFKEQYQSIMESNEDGKEALLGEAEDAEEEMETN